MRKLSVPQRKRWVVLQYRDLSDEFDDVPCVTAFVITRFHKESDAEKWAVCRFGREAVFESGDVRICED